MLEQVSTGGSRYEVHSRLGAGGLGTVYRAFDHHLQRWVAIKRLQASAGLSDAQLRQEATTLAALQHPNVVTVYDFGQDEDGPYVVMELIEGETLDHFIARGVLTQEDFVEMARQCLEGVQAAHHLALVHRDLKPGNVMVSWLPSAKFQVKVLDFGLARFSVEPRQQTLDHMGSLLGSIYYMSPEQFRNDPVDFRTDLYSLGVMFYFSLAGTPPFNGDSVAQVMAAHLRHEVVPLRQRRPDLTPALADWVMWLMNYDAADRPGNADAALASLGRLTTQAARPVATTVPVSVPRAGGSSAPWVWAAVGAVLVLAGAGWLASRRGPDPAPSAAVAEVPAVVEAAPAPSPGGTALRADDLERLRAAVGQVVTITGVPVKVSESRSGKVRYLNFSEDYRRTVALVFFTGDTGTAFPRAMLEPFVGRTVEVTGRLDDHEGALQIIVRDADTVRVRR